MTSIRRGDFDVTKSLLPDHHYILPVSSPITKLLVLYWDGWCEAKHRWWDFGTLHNIVYKIILSQAREHHNGEFTFFPNSPIASIFGSFALKRQEIEQKLENELIPIEELTLEELTSFYNPLCPCVLCRQEFDHCGNM